MVLYSHSRLEAFENCPLKYRLQYIDGVTSDEEGIEAFLGQRVHETLEKLYRDLRLSKLNSLEDLLEYYMELWDKNWHEDVVITRKDFTKKNYYDTGVKCITKYYERFKPFNQGTAVWTEEMVVFELGEYKLRGVVDRLDKFPDGSYEIHDYKTSGHVPSQKDMDESRQLALYEIAVRKKWKDVGKVRLVWHYVVFDQDIVSTRTSEQLKSLEKDCVALIDKIERTKEFKPTPSNLCDWCGYWANCPEKKHLVKIEELKPAEAAKEDGFALVNEYSKLKDKERKLGEEISLVKERLIEYARKEGLSRVRGSSQSASVKIQKVAGLPSKSSDAEGFKKMVEMVKAAGVWEDFSALDARALLDAVTEEKLDAKLLKKLKALLGEYESVSVRLSKLKDDEE